MNLKSILHSFFITIGIISLASFKGLAMEYGNSDESTLRTIHKTPAQLENFVERDLKVLNTILQKNNNDPYAYDKGYQQLGDSLIEFSKIHKNPDTDKNFSQVIELYETDKLKGYLNLPRITWLAVQLSMALTPENNSKKKVTSSASKTIVNLQKTHNGTPLWLLDIPTLEEYEKKNKQYFFTMLKEYHSFFAPMAVYQKSGTFTLKDYFKAMASGVFLFGLDSLQGKGHTVHGGIFNTCAEKLLHDMLHYCQLWPKDSMNLMQDERIILEYKKYAGFLKKLAEKVTDVLETDKSLSDNEKAQLEIFCFLMMHEGLYDIPSVLKPFKKGSLIDVMRLLADALQKDLFQRLSKPDNQSKFYEDYIKRNIEIEKNHLNFEFHSLVEFKDSPEETFETVLTYTLTEIGKNPNRGMIRQEWVIGEGNYEHWKSFYRDIGYLLMTMKLWTPKNKKLGVNYEMPKVKNTLESIYKWFMRATDKNGKLYEQFSKVTLSE